MHDTDKSNETSPRKQPVRPHMNWTWVARIEHPAAAPETILTFPR